jgi:hypothetical protein
MDAGCRGNAREAHLDLTARINMDVFLRDNLP